MSPTEEQQEAPQPTPIKTKNLLDSIFRDDGPMPPARLRIRALAFLLDFILLTVAASVIIWKFAIPQAHPGAFAELSAWTEQFLQWWRQAGENGGTAPVMSDNLSTALAYARDLQLLIFWLYFALGEAMFGGTSLGKKACRLRSVSTVTLDRPGFLTGIVRGGLKTIAIFFLFPLGLCATLSALFFNKRRQMGHDLLSRTAVVDEKFVHAQKPV